jgi:hypothetical protein
VRAARIAILVALAAALAPSSATATISTPSAAPSCVRENSCAFTACPSGTGGATYYVCDCNTAGTSGTVPAGGQQPASGCAAGNASASDSNAGTSPSAPWQHYDKARTSFTSLSANDRILFCNGGSWDLTGASGYNWRNANSTASNRVSIGSYQPSWGAGTEGRPILKLPPGNRAFDLDAGNLSPKAGYNFFGIKIEGLNQPASPTGASPECNPITHDKCPFEGFFFYNGITDITICDMDIEYVSIGAENAGGNNSEDDSGIIIRDSIIANNDGQGWLGGGTNNELDWNYFEQNGYNTANLDHHIYLSSGGATGVLVKGNELYKNAHVSGGSCVGAMLVWHGLFGSATITGNLFREDNGGSAGGCYCIGGNPGYTSTEQFANMSVVGNVFKNCGGEGISMSACHNCSIKDNLFLADTSSGFEAIALTNDGESGSDWSNVAPVVSGNMAYGNGVTMRDANAGTGLVWAGNVVWRTDTGTVACFTHSLSPVAYTFVDRNFCYAPNASTVNWNATGPTTRAVSCSSNSWDCNSTQGTNPGVVNARISTTFYGAAADFTPTSGSPLRGVGSATYQTSTDFVGYARPNPPAVGPLEFQTAAAAIGRAYLFFFGGGG